MKRFRRIALALAFALLAALPAPAEPIPDEEVPALLEALIGNDGGEARAAVARILARGDRRFTSVFIELLRASLAGAASPAVAAVSADALGALTGEAFGEDWRRWASWYAAGDLAPPPGFTRFKGELLGRIDLRFAALLRDDLPSRIRVEEIVWGGVPYEGIPALDAPATVPAGEATFLTDDEPVFGIFLNGEARAYPQRILDWHEMANDVLGGVRFSLAYCTLCGSAMAYRAEASNGGVYDFGSSGLLMRSNKLMVDRQTRTLWNQFTGRPVLGELARGDVRLRRLPVVVARFGDWKQRHPATSVVSLETGFERPYHPGAAYGGYFASDDTMFPAPPAGDRLPGKARIFALEVAGVPKAYPLALLLERRVVHDRVGEDEIVLLTGDEITVAGNSVRQGPAVFSAGAAVRAYRAGAVRFRREGGTLRDGRGRVWQEREDALIGPDGARAERLPGQLAYWFGWNAFHPGGLVYTPPAP